MDASYFDIKIEKYLQTSARVKRRLSRYSAISIIRKSKETFAELEDELQYLERQPWTHMLALKWRLENPSLGGAEIDGKNFTKLLNEIYGLQSVASQLDDEGLTTKQKIAPLIIQQNWFQGDSRDYIYTLLRLYMVLCDKPFEQNYYKKTFEKATGLSLEDFFQLAIIFAMHALGGLGKNQFYKLSDLIPKIHPTIDVEKFGIFVALLSVNIEDASVFLQEYTYQKGWPTDYYEESPFKLKPLILFGNELVPINDRLFYRGICEFPTRFFKSISNDFSTSFGHSIQDYMARLLTELNWRFVEDSWIKDRFGELNIQSQDVDFILDLQAPILMEVKAVQPDRDLTKSRDPYLLQKRVKSNLLKAVSQIQSVSYDLSLNNQVIEQPRFGLIITYAEYFISTAKDLDSQLNIDLEAKFIGKFGCCPISLDHIYIAPIHDIETLFNFLSQEGSFDLAAFLNDCVEADSRAETSKYTFHMHVRDRYKKEYGNTEILNRVLDTKIETFGKMEREHQKFWSMNLTEFFSSQKRLMAKIDSVHKQDRLP
jgi:hypothetical protein